MDDIETGQVSANAAEVYERLFVPALFAQWAVPMAEAARVTAGASVLDVGCGTGALTRELARRCGTTGRVVGLDVNPGMLEVARRNVPAAHFARGTAEQLPFDDTSFDAVTVQFSLMFFEDRTQALRETIRVLAPGGTLTLAVWAAIETSPGYREMRSLLDELFGPSYAAALDVPFNLGQRDTLARVLAGAGLAEASIETEPGSARFPSLASWVETDVRGWTLAGRIDDEQYARLLAAAEARLQHFVQPDGSVAFAAPAHLVRYRKPERATT